MTVLMSLSRLESLPGYGSAVQCSPLIAVQKLFFSWKKALRWTDLCAMNFSFVLYFPVTLPCKSYLPEKLVTEDSCNAPQNIIKRPILNTHQGRIQSISILSATPNAAMGVFQAGSTDSFSRAHFMVGMPLQTTDSICVCSHLITAFVVWSLKAVGKPNGAASNGSLTTHEWLKQVPGAIFHSWPREHRSYLHMKTSVVFCFLSDQSLSWNLN